ncbi:MAG: gamma-glutamylcyclotransferase [Candidatus Omnitrophica bacterium]|nr:gamma-glutamylcyclotransferase [Candidatus Omnitrophota bacterium]
MKYLIYAAYGSNLLKERFIVYIKGGYFENRHYEGSSDKSDPEDLGWIYVPHRLYFAKKSPTWDNKGVAFLSCKKEENPEYHAIVRLWKISEKQFEDLHKQEGLKWYHKIMLLGEKNGLLIKTFTGCWENEKQEPSEKYLNIIKKGLKETTDWNEQKIEEYIKKFL